jgi:hypothetical protein
MTSGILPNRSSFLAISRGSVSPSSWTNTGAFILRKSVYTVRYGCDPERPSSRPQLDLSYSIVNDRVEGRGDVPDLQSPGTQDPRSFVFGQVGRGHPDSVGSGDLAGPDARLLLQGLQRSEGGVS